MAFSCLKLGLRSNMDGLGATPPWDVFLVRVPFSGDDVVSLSIPERVLPL